MRLTLLTFLAICGSTQVVDSLQPSSRIFVPSFGAKSAIKKNPSSPLFFGDSTATPSTMSGNEEQWTKPRLHNTAAFRSLAILGALAAAGVSSKSPLTLLSAQSTAALHLFSYATWFGTMAYTTFVLGITMFKNLPRKTFGKLQAKLFPKYFALSSVTIILQVRSM